MIANGIIGLIIGYLLGSIPTAYLAARLVKGIDIRKIGSGNVGGLNTYRQIGTKAAVVVAMVDIGKGSAAVAVAYWLLALDPRWVMGAGLAAVIGHMWMVWLKFQGGKAVGTMVGVLSAMLPLLGGYWPELLVFFAMIAIPLFITHNVALSTFIGLVSLPFIMWVGRPPVDLIVWSAILGLIIILRYLPTARAAWIKVGDNKRAFFFDSLRGRGG
jgi:glycerol-3-phosphate acyltransferase PlsY